MTLQDVRYGCRSLLSAPGFSLVLIITLAMGIGLTLSMISVMRAVFLASASISRPKSNCRHSRRCP